MVIHAIAIGKLAERCSRGKFNINVLILEEYETICKIQLENENGFKLITLTEISNLEKKA